MNWKMGIVLVLFLASCSTPNDMRVVITSPATNPPTSSQETKTTQTQSPVISRSPPTQIVGSFAVNPIAVHTLPATPEPTRITTPEPMGEDNTKENSELSKISIEALANRTYGQDAGTLTFESTLEDTGGFKRSLFSYPSDGLKIYGFINIPPGIGPFPVVIFLHGYVKPQLYEMLDYSVRYADDLARRGFIVIHPNLRGYPPSDDGPDLFDTGKAIDVLNLAAIIQRDAGTSGLLLQADPNKIAVWGHSTGGGIAIRAITVNMPSVTDSGPAIKAAILYAPMSGDEAKNVYQNYYVFSQTRWEKEILIPVEEMFPISPLNFYNRIDVPVQVHHGRVDKLIPVEWSRETCEQMQAVGITVECYEYRTQTHNFCCDSYQWMFDRIVTFLFIHMP